MRSVFLIVGLVAGSLSLPHWAAEPETRLLRPDDILNLRGIEGPSFSPDGSLIAYALKTVDVKKDRVFANLWLARSDGSENKPLTNGDSGVSHPRFSPDGKLIAFLSSRDDDNDADQLWVVPLDDMQNLRKVTQLAGGVEDFDWSPDSRRLVLVARDAPSQGLGAQPIVVDRFQFKRDGENYLTHRYSQLHLLELATKEVRVLTSGAFDNMLPSWSPDGAKIAFVSKRGEDPDRSANHDIYVIEARVAGRERQLTKSIRSDADPIWGSPPVWSPDSKSIAFLRGGEPKKLAYATNAVAIMAAEGGEPRVLTAKTDRNFYSLKWTSDGLFALIEDDGTQNVVNIDVKTGSHTLVSAGGRTVGSFDIANGRIALRMSTPESPVDIFVMENGAYHNVTKQNEGFRKSVRLGKVLESRFKSSDGTTVHGFIIRPPEASNQQGPAILWLHGGPQSQYSHEFEFSAQVFAAAGYTVIMPNPRGSTGRGTDYSMGIYAAWGTKDVKDNLAAVDNAILRGFADPNRLGVGGWSYGGMATNYLIASTPRFKAAISGAAISNNLAGYGTDEYTYDYETELGVPWKNLDRWLRVSYPFYQADRIKTPTLFVVGEDDGNLGPHNSEQMYQALRSLRVPTQLIVYPGQHHSITKPSFQIDRLNRYLDWYKKWLK